VEGRLSVTRTLASSGSPLEREIGFSRAVRIGPMIAVSGTAPLGSDGKTVGIGDAYAQTHRCLEIILAAITSLGGTIDGVIRTRVFLTDIAKWRDAARAHGEVFADVRPACTFAEVSGLIDPAWLVEIEADCYVAT
jgi:enamine deaminase RidA (YjgF/YER057c/UK114 family)